MNKHKKNFTKKRTWLFRLMIACVLTGLGLLTIFYINLGPQNTNEYKGPRTVTIKKINGHYNFYRNGKRFIVKGGVGYTHIRELSECGGNTITCWDTSKIENTLKEADRNNVAVIIGLDLPGGDDADFYNNRKYVTALLNAYSGIVNRYKDHPSILAWCLGNELVTPFTLIPSPFYKTYNLILDRIHNIDRNHPVCTSIINTAKRRVLMIRWRMPSLDFYCFNIYNSIKTMQKQLDLLKLFWHGPYLIGEWAPIGGWEAQVNAWQAPIENTSTKKAKQFYEFYTKYMPLKDPRFLGSIVFYWGFRQEYTCTWFSIFNEDGIPTEIEETLSDCWKNTYTQHLSPKLKNILVDTSAPQDNIMFTPGSKHHVSLLLQKPTSASDRLHYSWELIQEDWFGYWSKKFNFLSKPPPEIGLFSDSTLQSTSFTAPTREGPYRIFVTVYNCKGYCATANTPIYVLK